MMRYFLSLLFLIVFLNPGHSQTQINKLQENAYVGIGILGPSAPLHVVGELRSQGQIRLQSSDGNDAGFIETTNGAGSANGVKFRSSRGSGYFSFTTNYNSNSEKFRIQNNGNVGIGTSSPSYKLHVIGSGRFNGTGSSYTEINSNGSGAYMWQYNASGILSWVVRGYSHTFQAEFRHGGISANGTVKAKEVNITATGWPDYVFSDGYELSPLSEVKDFYTKNKHLPNIPSENEIAETGVNVSEMTIKLLEKIEELTIYLVEQNERINQLEKKLIEKD